MLIWEKPAFVMYIVLSSVKNAINVEHALNSRLEEQESSPLRKSEPKECISGIY